MSKIYYGLLQEHPSKELDFDGCEVYYELNIDLTTTTMLITHIFNDFYYGPENGSEFSWPIEFRVWNEDKTWKADYVIYSKKTVESWGYEVNE